MFENDKKQYDAKDRFSPKQGNFLVDAHTNPREYKATGKQDCRNIKMNVSKHQCASVRIFRGSKRNARKRRRKYHNCI